MKKCSIFHLLLKTPLTFSKKFFLLFDSVHILKRIRNIWIKLKIYKKQFFSLDITSRRKQTENAASSIFGVGAHLYHMNVCCSKKFNLNQLKKFKTNLLNQSKQKTQGLQKNLCKIFTIENVAALKCLIGSFYVKFENWQKTSTFLTIICK